METKNFTELVCPHCGGHIALPEHQSVITGVTVAKDSGLGTVVLPAEGTSSSGTRAEFGTPVRGKFAERLIKLQQAGINTDGYFTVTNKKGEEVAMHFDENDIPVVVSDADFTAWETKIKSGGTIRSGKLWRRWIMSQMFHLLREDRYYDGFTANVHRRGYIYQWEMLLEEFRMQVKLKDKDPECFLDRDRWYNPSLLYSMLVFHMSLLEEFVKASPVRKYKGEPYITTSIGYTLVKDVETKVYAPVRRLIGEAYRLVSERPADAQKICYDIVKQILDKNSFVSLGWKQTQCREWMDAFKGYGAYFTLQNLILFHGCKVYTRANCWDDKSKCLSVLSGEEAWQYVKLYLENGNYGRVPLEGYELFAFMKQVIKDNDFDFQSRMKQIYAEKK